ncbi:type II/IV secretion system ATPase subunit [Archaeoglobus veneficus]|uniref:Type II secretion system protein E n=1 Tax=Archaeoglobus veneficus (strain DSM 11195 / SNP6) TaxID=693661 RepID=F2KMX1_ARCVS|nr:type II/IV secretion system ATPase subunit [Archaeoglobus veneficus]AEA47247.1 type II secretion system protein E [Archaeoglobus veneficus SNP6]
MRFLRRSKQSEEEKLEEHEKEALEAIERAKKVDKVLKGEEGGKKGLIRKKPIFEPYDEEVHGPLIEFEVPEDWSVVEEYWIQKPYSKVIVLYSDKEHDHRYIVVEPELDAYETEVFNEVKDALRDVLEEKDVESALKEQVLKETVDFLLKDMKIPISAKSYYKILYHIVRDFIYYGKITPLMLDKMLEDISCNGYNKPIYVFHRNYANVETNIVFEEEELDAFVITLAQRCGKHISIAEPMVDATMPDGSRIQMTLGKEVTDHGSTFTIRKFRDVPITPIDLVAWGTFSAEQMAYLWLCIENKKSLIFAGGTASGKTTSMNAISLFIPRRAKIVTIEDTRELMLPHENWIPAVTRDAFHGEAGAIDMYDLLRAALRQRPEYILVGEVRGKEALTLFQAMSTGHTTYSTLHADSVNGVIHRLENPPINVPRPMIEALDIVSIQAQTFLGKKRVRRNIEIAEIVGLDPYTKMIRTTTVFQWDSVKDEHAMIGASKALEDIRRTRGWSVAELQQELARRVAVINFMIEHNLRDFKTVSNIIHTYQSRPEKVLEKMGITV